MKLVSELLLNALREQYAAPLGDVVVAQGYSEAARGQAGALENYVIFRHTGPWRAAACAGLSEAEVFSNCFYWFRVLCCRIQRSSGFDAGLEQQTQQLLAEAPTHSADWDWSIVEELQDRARQS